MYFPASTSAVVHVLVVTVGLLGWPALDLAFNEKFGRAPTQDVLTYGEASEFQARFQSGAVTDDAGEETELETVSGIDPDNDLETMSSGDVGFDEPGDGPQDSSRAGEPDALKSPDAPLGDAGTGKDRGEESPSDGEREDGGDLGEAETAGAETREIVVFVTLRPEPRPDAEPIDPATAAAAGPTETPAATPIESEGEKPGELAALMQGEPTPEKEVTRAGQEGGILEGEAETARKSEIEPTRAAAPNPGDPSPPDRPDLPASDTEGTSAPEAPVEDRQSLAPTVAASARKAGDDMVGEAHASEEPQVAATASGRPGREDAIAQPTDAPRVSEAIEPLPELQETVPIKGTVGLDTPAPLREDHLPLARDESGEGPPQIGARLSGLREEIDRTRGPEVDVAQPEQLLNTGNREATADLSDSAEIVMGGAVGEAERAESETGEAVEGLQTAAVRTDRQFRAPTLADADQPALSKAMLDPLAKVIAAIAGENERMARALSEPSPSDAIGGTPQPGALKTNQLLEQAAEAGLAKAQLELAKRYIVGLVEGRDPEKLVELLRNAAEQGEVEAQLLLGTLFADGRIVSRDFVQSRVFFDLAAAQGSIEAKEVIPVVERQMAPQEIADSFRLAREYRRLLQAMPKPKSRGDLGEGLRHQLLDAAAAGNTAKIAELLARGADLEGSDTSGRTAVINAAWRGRGEVVDLLVELGADFNVTDYDGRTALSWAASNGHDSIVEKLVGAGAEADIMDQNGLTPLMRAAWNGHDRIVRLLLDSGARASSMDPEGNTALDYAIRGGHREIARVLKSFGA